MEGQLKLLNHIEKPLAELWPNATTEGDIPHIANIVFSSARGCRIVAGRPNGRIAA